MKKENFIELNEADVFSIVNEKLLKHGCDSKNAFEIAKTIIAAEIDGCSAHGLFRIPGYISSLKSGKVNGESNPKVVQIAPVVFRIEGDRGFAPLALSVSYNPLIECAKKNGLAAAAIVNIHHFSALWHEVEHIALEGLAGLACTVSKPVVAPAGANTSFFGTNPMAFSWPRKNENPMVFDQASAAMARGEIMIAALEGSTLPQGVGIDKSGNPTNDPKKILDGSQLTFGGYKGSSVAMMIELLAAGLIGDNFSFERGEKDNNDGGPTRGGELIIAINPNLFGDENNWHKHCELFFSKLMELEGIRLPGDRRLKNRDNSKINGIKISRTIYEKVKQL
ncbi:MAG: delta1-piperideine-2-carboxylate reductase [Flavobacteriaceae bacterium]